MFPTPISAGVLIVARALSIPVGFLPLITGALTFLLKEMAWDETEGGMTIEDTIQVVWSIFHGYITGQGGDASMIGMIAPFPFAPDDSWLLCAGGTFQREDYPDLYLSLPITYIIDSEQFMTPDLSDIFILGAGASFPSGSQGGEVNHTLTTAEMPVHTHVQNSHGHTAVDHTHTQQSHTHSIPNHSHDLIPSLFFGVRETASAYVSGSGLLQRGSATTVNSQVQVDLPSRTEVESMTLGGQTAVNNNATVTINSQTAVNQNAGTGTTHNNMPPFLSLPYYIKGR